MKDGSNQRRQEPGSFSAKDAKETIGRACHVGLKPDFWDGESQIFESHDRH